jgi:hypothetical protein
LGPREGCIGVVERGLRLFDLREVLAVRRLERDELVANRCELRFSASKCNYVRLIIKAEEHVAGRDLLVAAHVDLFDYACNLIGHIHDGGASIGVVG